MRNTIAGSSLASHTWPFATSTACKEWVPPGCQYPRGNPRRPSGIFHRTAGLVAHAVAVHGQVVNGVGVGKKDRLKTMAIARAKQPGRRGDEQAVRGTGQRIHHAKRRRNGDELRAVEAAQTFVESAEPSFIFEFRDGHDKVTAELVGWGQAACMGASEPHTLSSGADEAPRSQLQLGGDASALE